MDVNPRKLRPGKYVLAVEALHHKNADYLRQYHIIANVEKMTKSNRGCADLILCACITKAIQLQQTKYVQVTREPYRGVPSCYRAVDSNLGAERTLYAIIIVSNMSRYEVSEDYEFMDLGGYQLLG